MMIRYFVYTVIPIDCEFQCRRKVVHILSKRELNFSGNGKMTINLLKNLVYSAQFPVFVAHTVIYFETKCLTNVSYNSKMLLGV